MLNLMLKRCWILMMIIFVKLLVIVNSYEQLVSPNQINISVWTEVIRRSCVNIAQIHIDRNIVNVVNGLKIHGGWYEGYSSGTPVNWNNLKKVGFGCWYGLYPSNIYVNIDLASRRFNVVHGSDKYYCEAALKEGYTGFISSNEVPSMKPMINYEVTVCNGTCSTVTFNNTCAPLEHRYGRNAEFICNNCNDSYKNINCGDNVPIPDLLSDNWTERINIAKHKFQEQYYRSIKDNQYVTRKQNLSHQLCIMRYKDFDLFRLKNTQNLNMNIVFTNHLLAFDLNAYNKFYSTLKTINSNLRNRLLILNYELFNIYEYNNIHNIFNTTTIINNSSSILLQRLHKDSYYELLSLWISPWNYTIPTNTNSKPLLYSLNTHSKSETFLVNGLIIGIITYTIDLISNIHDLKQWISNESQCLRKIGSDIVIVIGNGDHLFNNDLLLLANHTISFVLTIDHHRDKNYIDLNSINPIKIHQNHDRIIKISSNHHSNNNRIDNVNEIKRKFYAHIKLTLNNEYFNLLNTISYLEA